MKLRFTYGGRWYLGLIALLGVVCGISNNNVIYLIESILVASLVVSVLVAARMTSGLSLEYRRSPAIAGEPSRDQLRVLNRGRGQRFCVEIGEWAAGRFHAVSFLPRVPSRASASARSRRVFSARGRHAWDALALASSFPFGFIQIIRLRGARGSRVVWPAPSRSRGPGAADAGLAAPRAGTALLEGEIRAMNPDDDSRSVIWTLSARGGDPMVRARGSERGEPAVVLDLCGVETGEALERRISAAASAFYETGVYDLRVASGSGGPGGGGLLVLLEPGGRRTIHGATEALDQLATVRPTTPGGKAE